MLRTNKMRPAINDNLVEEIALYKAFLNDESINDRQSLELLEIAIENDVDPDTQNEAGDTILHILARNNVCKNSSGNYYKSDNIICGKFDETIDRLVNINKADISFHNNAGLTPFQSTFRNIENACARTIMKLMALGANPEDFNEAGETIIHWYIKKYIEGTTRVFISIKELVETYKVDINIQDSFGMTPIQMVMNSKVSNSFAENAKRNLIFALLELGANASSKDKDGNTILHLLSFSVGNHADIETLLKYTSFHPYDIHSKNNENYSPFEFAVKLGSVSYIELFAKYNINNRSEETIAFKSLLMNLATDTSMSYNVAMALIAMGVSPDTQNANGDTILHILARNNERGGYDSLIAKLVKENKANINIKNNDNLTPIQIVMNSTHNKRIDRIFMFLALGANASSRENSGNTILHLVVLFGSQVNLEALLNNPTFDATDINSKNNAEASPFRLAVQTKKSAMVKQLGQFKDNRRRELNVLALNILFGEPHKMMLLVTNSFLAEIAKNCLSGFLNGDTYLLDILKLFNQYKETVSANFVKNISSTFFMKHQTNIQLLEANVEPKKEYDPDADFISKKSSHK